MIEKVGDRVNPALAPNDAMIEGISQRACYQPLFGYRLERFPAEPLQAGPVISLVGDRFINMKNPACYLFAAENGCKPGDHFRIDRAKDAIELLSYRPFAFEQPYWQIVATWLSLWSAIAGRPQITLHDPTISRSETRRRTPHPRPVAGSGR
jgi:hypothetical protein